VCLFDKGPKTALPKRLGQLNNRLFRVVCAVFFLTLTSSLWGYSADLVLIRSAGEPSAEQHQLELATQFYGLDLTVVIAGVHNDSAALSAVQWNATLAVAIEANALASINQKALLRALRRRLGGSVPLLILGVTPETDPTLLSTWSSGAAVSVKSLSSPGGLNYIVGNVAGITTQLTDLEIPFRGDDTFYFALDGRSKPQEIMRIGNNRRDVPVFVEADFHRQKVFLLCKTRPFGKGIGSTGNTDSTVTAFAEIAPVMIFTKYCAGERGWHALHHYANLTIDDPWLREPYGHLSYKSLLKAMEDHNFHTTIAFIPWNYDRSDAEAIAVFRNHPEKFSICVHGDNHDHKEFDDLESKPLSLQIAAIKQSLARMEKFQTLTGIPYDNVFVFPHNIGSENILEELKKYNFAATVNSMNVPMDRTKPASPFFALRPVTLSFGDFPSISRYSASMPNPDLFIGVNEFLDNPVLFYGHQDLFDNGIGAFDGVADEVNKLQPDTRWRSLGDIARNLYLIRLKDDFNYDVLAFSSSLDLNNTAGRNSVFDIQKQEADSAAIASVSVEDRVVPYEWSGGHLHLSVDVPAGESRRVIIRYKNDLDLASVTTSKNSLRVYFLRMISDFRDITLSKFFLGRAVTEYYYKDQKGTVIVVGCGFVVILAGIYGIWRLLLIRKRKTSVALRSCITPTVGAASATHEGCARS
jgi:hypothetical protein